MFDCNGVLYGAGFGPGRINTALIDCLKEYQADCKIGLLSNMSRERLDTLLASMGLDGRFDAVLASSEVAHPKPHPEMFEQICEQLQVLPSEVLYLDDSPDSIAGARAVGLQAHLFADTAEARAWIAAQMNRSQTG